MRTGVWQESREWIRQSKGVLNGGYEMIKAVFIDFYGTVVFEDGEVIKKVEQEIFATGKAENTSEIGSYWWKEFQAAFHNAFGDRF